MSPLVQRVINISLVLVSLFVAAEAASAAWYFVTSRQIFYTRPAAPPATLPALGVKTAVLHPLFGYVLQSGVEFKYQGHPLAANNHGFQSKLDYPHIPAADDFVVGVFGGSVASGLIYAEQFSPAIAERLSADPLLRGRRVVVLNLANAGYKQPEQVSVLGYYLSAGQKLDVVVNLDGVNELVSGFRNLERNIALAMPPIDVLGAMYSALDKGSSRSASAVAAAYHARRNEAELEAVGGCALAVCYTWHYFNAAWHANKRRASEAAALAAPDTTSSFKLYNDDNPNREPKSRMGELADLWERSSIVMDGMARSAGATYVHVLQPNQYLKTERKYAPEEEKVAFGLDSGGSYTQFPLETGYPLLVEKVDTLKRRGIAVFAATRIYDAEAAPIYVDACCHVNETGNRILGQFVADSISEALRAPSSALKQ